MPSVNNTIDNANPLIYYSPGQWSDGTHTDPYWTEYFQGTYAVTTTAGAYAEFNFTGTDVWLYGAFRDNHGIYNVTIDGQMSTYNGTAGGAGLFQQVMFSATGMDQGFHSVRLINTKKPGLLATEYYLDLDFIVWQSEIGDPSDTLNTTTVDDTDPGFQWGPLSTAWTTAFANLTQFHGGTGHSTVSPSAYATYTFNGNAVSIYGAVGPDQGPYSVQIDSGPITNYTAASTTFEAQSLLYIADGLSDGQHTVKLLNAPDQSGKSLSIDYAIIAAVQVPLPTTTSSSSVTSATSISSSSDTTTSTDTAPSISTTPTDSKKSVSTGAVVAAVVGVLALMAMLSFALMMFRKRRKEKREEMEPDMMTVAFPEPYSYTGRYIPPSENMSNGYNPLEGTSTPLYPPNRAVQAQEGLVFPSYGYRNGDGVSIFSGGQPAVAPRQSAMSGGSDQIAGPALVYNRNRNPSDTSGVAPYGTEFAYSGISDGTSLHPAHGHSAVDGQSHFAIPPLPIAGDGGYPGNPGNQRILGLHNPPPQPHGLIPPRKGAVTLPPTASVEEQRQFQALSEQELRQRRMHVEGRAQDFGPVIEHPLNIDRPLPELPPDYNQATEALSSSEELTQSSSPVQTIRTQPSPPSQSPQPGQTAQPIEPSHPNQTEVHITSQ